MSCSNKWVLNTTSAPLFFLLAQLLIAILLFLGAHMAGFIQIPLQLDLEVCKGLIPMVALNVIGLRCVQIIAFDECTDIHLTVRVTIP
jgi:solute carrier family 35 (GDP-fucose transporter), member C1